MKRATYLILTVVIVFGTQTFSPSSGEGAEVQRTMPAQTQRAVPMSQAPLAGGAASIEVQGLFTSWVVAIKGIGNENEVIEQKVVQGKVPLVQKAPGRLKVSDIVIRRNISGNLDFFKWRKTFVEGGLSRKNGSIIFYDAKMIPLVRYDFSNAWPSQYKGITIDGQSPQSV